MLIKCTFLSLIQLIACQRPSMEPFIVGGRDAKIEQHPHSVYMGSTCSKGALKIHWRCGSSVVNQWFLLTAAHCFDCASLQQTVFTVGSSNIKGTFITTGHKFIVHPQYKLTTQSHDIAVVKIKNPLPLSHKVSRVALMRNPPYNEPATVAGWGVMDEATMTVSNNLQFTRQTVMSRLKCMMVLGKLPEGCLCADSRYGNSYASMGDSGNALVVRGYIQIGIVSFKKPPRSVSVTAYTDTGYFYDWIINTIKSLYCQ